MPASARWQPQNWRLRTKLIALTVIPLALALVLGTILVVHAAKGSHSSALRDLVIIGVFVLLALIVLAVLVRSILKPVRVLRASAFDVADHRLPAVIDQLRTTEGRSKDIKIDPVPVYSREDVGQVARAFDAVHSEAVRLASEQAALRANINDMFVNLSRRTQSLVERQLQLIDQLELGEQDSDRLAALFRLDHLATRMRRNGENLLVLAGAELRQRSGEPVPMVDVVRAAISEIEDYRRVAMQTLPVAMVSGLAVNDIVHLIAEVLDNATAYSDPESLVKLSASIAPDGGLAIEISDVGAGLPGARLHEINQRLAAPPAVDVSVSRQMGLFVVGRLASRHGITVRLASQVGSGITVTVNLPREMITTEHQGNGTRANYAGRSYSQVTTVDTAQEGGLLREPPVFAPPPPPPPPVPAFAELQPLGLLDALPAADDNGADTPIFAAMLSKWFTERQQAVWESEADAGWQAAEAASEATSEPAALEMTAAGLPKRHPQAFLVPGSIGPGGLMSQPAAPPTRPPDAMRDRMSSYQRGLARGRHARPGKPPEQVGAGNDQRDDPNMPEANR
jgi:signal transduction histidine kinase